MENDSIEALMSLDHIELISSLPSETIMKTLFEGVSGEIEELKLDKIRNQREQIKKAEDRQNLQAPYKDIIIPENIKLTTHVRDIMYNFSNIPQHWNSENPAILSESINIIRDKISSRLFPEGFEKETAEKLEYAIFSLLFDTEIGVSKLIYPVYRVLYLANEYIITMKDEINEETIKPVDILNHLKTLDPNFFREKLGGDVFDYLKIIIYRALLERIGTVNLPKERQKGAFNVPRDMLVELIPIDRLIELGLVGKEDDYISSFEKSRIIGERAKEIQQNAPLMTDPGDLIDPILIAEKELKELVIPMKICRIYPDGSEKIRCISSLAKAKEEFYDFLKEDLDKVSIEGLYDIAIENGYSGEIRDMLLTFVENLGVEPDKEFLNIRTLSDIERVSLVNDVKDLLLESGLNPEEIRDPLYILNMLIPRIKTYPALKHLLVLDICSNFFDIYSYIKWVNIPGSSQVDSKDRPRRLYKEEIDDILNYIPQVKSALKGLSSVSRKSIQEKMRPTLEEIEICPSGIPELKQTIVVQFNKSRIDTGSPVGINAADALGEQVSQMTLNSVVGETKILISIDNVLEEIKIGDWIDTLMKTYSLNIKLYPKNRTEYLDLTQCLDKKVEIKTVDKIGKIFWSRVTAVTRHLPGNNLVKITTESDITVTLTESKSLLIWNENKQILEQRNGSDARIGDFVPIEKEKSSISTRIINDIVLEKIIQIENISCDEKSVSVYDLTVPSTTNFCLSNGLGVADTFHSAGSNKNMSSGIRALSELIYAMKTRKNNNCLIVFKERLSFEEIIDKESEIVETNVGQLVVEYYMDHPDNFEEKYWWEKYFEFEDMEVDENTRVLKLELDTVLMAERRITIKDIVESLDKDKNKNGIPPGSMYFAHSPTSDGILYIYPNPDRIKQPITDIENKINQESIVRTSHREGYRSDVFLNNIVLANLDDVHIKGVLDIKGIYVSETPILSMISKEYKITEPYEISKYNLIPDEIYWKIIYDTNLLEYSPMNPGMLLELLEFIGYTIIVSDENYSIVKYKGLEDDSGSLSKSENVKPSDIIHEEIGKIDKIEDKSTLDAKQKKLNYLQSYNFLNTRGSNINGLMQKIDIDMFYSYSNNIHLMIKFYGVEAARQFFIKDLYDTFTNQSGYVNSRNISLLADFLFRYGSFLGTTYTGMKAGTMGYFSLATFERSLEVLVKAAIFSETETLEGVSASIAVGKPITIGTGYFNVISENESRVMADKKQKEAKKKSDARAITLAFQSQTDKDISGEYENDLDFVDNFWGSEKYDGGLTLEDRIDEGPSKIIELETSKDSTDCPTSDTIQPSEMLEEIMEIVPLERETTDSEIESKESFIVEIPSEIKQSPLRTKGSPMGAHKYSVSREKGFIEEGNSDSASIVSENLKLIDIPVIMALKKT